MNKLNTKFIIPIATAVVSIIFIYLGITKYGFWQNGKGPMSGFYPILISIALLFTSILAFLQAFHEKVPAFPKENWLVALSVVLIITASYLIGMIPSVLIFILVWVRYVEKFPWKTAIATMLFIGCIAIGIFVLWLDVQFPKGILLQAVLK